jgi:hypothetical protein
MLVADAKADRSISVAFSESPLPQEVRAINFPLELIMPRTSWGRGLGGGAYSFHVWQYVVISESKHLPSFGFEKPLSLSVLFVLKVVASAIKLDYDTLFDTSKIGEVRPDRMLAAKLQSR